MPDENEVAAPVETTENAADTNVEQDEQQESEVSQEETGDQPAEQPKAEPNTDWKKQYDELQKLGARQGNELGEARRQLRELQQQVERFKPKEEPKDPFEKNAYLKALPENQKQLLKEGVKAVLDGMGVNLNELPQIKQRIENQEQIFRNSELREEVRRLKETVGEEMFNKHVEAVQDKYDQMARSMGLNYWPQIPLEDVFNMVTAKELKSSLAERAKRNIEQRAQRVAAADTGKTSPKVKPPTGLDDEALAKMSPRQRFNAILAEEQRRPG